MKKLKKVSVYIDITVLVLIGIVVAIWLVAFFGYKNDIGIINGFLAPFKVCLWALVLTQVICMVCAVSLLISI